MAKWISLSSARISLVADPNKSAAAGQKGGVKLVYENNSFVPLTAKIITLDSSNKRVASTTKLLQSVDISGRSRSGKAKGSKPIGSWEPLSQGTAILDADVDMHDDAGQRLDAGTSSDDVQVT
jgi:hypothetical protein